MSGKEEPSMSQQYDDAASQKTCCAHVCEAVLSNEIFHFQRDIWTWQCIPPPLSK